MSELAAVLRFLSVLSVHASFAASFQPTSLDGPALHTSSSGAPPRSVSSLASRRVAFGRSKRMLIRPGLSDVTRTELIALGMISSSSAPAGRRDRRAFPKLCEPPQEQKPFLLQALDDILDYLTNMGGYTGFTEEQLKGGESAQSGRRLSETDLEKFGQAKQGLNDSTINAFIATLIIFPLAALLLAAKIFGPPALFNFPTS
uniref:Uncharacterized protein n=1 Tax=Chrysotila carterae TaxID=13221 RepID=A0A7S4BEP1_CHRCT|mmetsp:Transcript_12866/g.27420  ORF Transcript_12866/g.27420 Transcript_12866/m.27420 type:complete len:202 (+) Transcript_12866:241-846(+)